MMTHDQRQRRGCSKTVGGVQSWSNQIPNPAKWVTHRLENNYTEEVLALLWRFWTPSQAPQHGHLTKGLGISLERETWGPTGYDYWPSRGLRETASTLGELKQKFACTKTRRRRELTPQETNKNYLLVLEGLLWRHGSSGAYHRDRETGRSPLA